MINANLDRKDLEALVKGCPPYYGVFKHPLVIKAGHQYSDLYGETRWTNLKNLLEDELYELYLICKRSWL